MRAVVLNFIRERAKRTPRCHRFTCSDGAERRNHHRKEQLHDRDRRPDRHRTPGQRPGTRLPLGNECARRSPRRPACAAGLSRARLPSVRRVGELHGDQPAQTAGRVAAVRTEIVAALCSPATADVAAVLDLATDAELAAALVRLEAEAAALDLAEARDLGITRMWATCQCARSCWISPSSARCATRSTSGAGSPPGRCTAPGQAAGTHITRAPACATSPSGHPACQ